MVKERQESKKIKTKEDLRQLLLSCKSKLPKLNIGTWHFSVFFFVTIFIVSIWVWWVGFYAPRPSQEVIDKFESSNEDFEAMKTNTETAIELLKERRDKIKNAPDFFQQRDLFIDRREVGLETKENNEEALSEPEIQPEVESEPTIIDLRRESESLDVSR